MGNGLEAFESRRKYINKFHTLIRGESIVGGYIRRSSYNGYVMTHFGDTRIEVKTMSLHPALNCRDASCAYNYYLHLKQRVEIRSGYCLLNNDAKNSVSGLHVSLSGILTDIIPCFIKTGFETPQ